MATPDNTKADFLLLATYRDEYVKEDGKWKFKRRQTIGEIPVPRASIARLPAMRLLLISNSTLHGSGYLDHCAGAIASFLGPSVKRVLFVPYALFDRDGYAAKARTRFEAMGYGLDSVHDLAGGPVTAVDRAEALFIGGGNTFRLLDALWRHELIEPIRRRVRAGLPYVGTSAGSNVACPSIRTTNDMPIVQPPSFEALDLVPFNINPHYQDPIPRARRTWARPASSGSPSSTRRTRRRSSDCERARGSSSRTRPSSSTDRPARVCSAGERRPRNSPQVRD